MCLLTQVQLADLRSIATCGVCLKSYRSTSTIVAGYSWVVRARYRRSSMRTKSMENRLLLSMNNAELSWSWSWSRNRRTGCRSYPCVAYSSLVYFTKYDSGTWLSRLLGDNVFYSCGHVLTARSVISLPSERDLEIVEKAKSLAPDVDYKGGGRGGLMRSWVLNIVDASEIARSPLRISHSGRISWV